MIYGYDQAVQMPVKDLYDSQIMLASINAAKDMYEKGVQEMKDFNKTYGDFISPIQKDVDYWNNTVLNPVKDAVNKMYAMGIDPTRSAEGRAYIQRLISQVPVAEINKRRQAAAVAQEYIKNRGLLESKGLYNPDFEKYILNGKSLEDWDTATDGMWTRTSPQEFKTLNQATSSWFDDMKGSDKGTKNGFRYFGVDDSDLRAIAKPRAEGFKDTTLGSYYYDNIKRKIKELYPSMTDAQLSKLADDQFMEDIVTANKRHKFMKAEADPYAMDDYRTKNDIYAAGKKEAIKFNYTKKEYELKDENDRKKFEREHGGANVVPTNWTSQKTYSAQQKYNNKVTASDQNYRQTTLGIAKFWANKAKTSTGKQKAYAEKISKYWTRISNEGLSKAVKNKILTYDNATKQYRPTALLSREIFKAYGAQSTGTTGGRRAMDVANKYYSRFQNATIAGADGKTAADQFAGTTAPKGKYRAVDLTDKDLVYTPDRKLQVAGYGRIKDGGIRGKFRNWLKAGSKEAWMYNERTYTASIPRQDGGESIDINGWVNLRADEFTKFANAHGYTGDRVKKLASRLGLQLYSRANKVVDSSNGKQKWQDVEYISVPITRIMKNGEGYSFAEVDKEYDKNRYGANATFKMASDREGRSVVKK